MMMIIIIIIISGSIALEILTFNKPVVKNVQSSEPSLSVRACPFVRFTNQLCLLLEIQEPKVSTIL
jgi:hypothetical protein